MTKRFALANFCLAVFFLSAMAPATAFEQTANYSGQWKSTSVTIEPDPGYFSLPGVNAIRKQFQDL